MQRPQLGDDVLRTPPARSSGRSSREILPGTWARAARRRCPGRHTMTPGPRVPCRKTRRRARRRLRRWWRRPRTPAGRPPRRRASHSPRPSSAPFSYPWTTLTARSPSSRDFPPRSPSSSAGESRTARLAPSGRDPARLAPVGVGAGAVGVPTPEMRRPRLSISSSPSRNAPESVRSYGLASSFAVGSEMVTFLRLSGIAANPAGSSAFLDGPARRRSARRKLQEAPHQFAGKTRGAGLITRPVAAGRGRG